MSGNAVHVGAGRGEQQRRTPAAAPRRSVAQGGAAQASDLEGFFPFDPYRLRGTAERFVDPLYRHWNDVAPQGLGAGDDDETSEDEDDETGESEEDSSEEDDEDDGPDYDDSLAMSPHAVEGGGLQIPGAREKAQRTATAADAKFARSMELMSVSGS